MALSHGIYHGKLRTVVNRENKIVKIISASLSFETQIISSSNHLKSISHLIFPDRWLTKKNGEEPPEKEKQQTIDVNTLELSCPYDML